MNEDFLQGKLAARIQQHSLRRLREPDPRLVDFSSNDYLGIARHHLLLSPGTGEINNHVHSSGSTGSRLLTGNYELIGETENFIAAFHEAEAGLIFNSGYDANLGLLSCVPQRGDTILYDYLSHASIRDGIRLSFADSFSFRHNDLADLEARLKKATGNCFVVTESVFSMDGDTSPLSELVTLCEQYQANLVVDEAHATGVMGSKGEGLVQSLHLQNRVFARVHTFGKACGVHGAIVLGSALLREYLVNFARPFIYSTSLPSLTIAHIRSSYELFPGMINEREQLGRLIGTVQSFARQGRENFKVLDSQGPIQAVVIPGNEQVKRAGMLLMQNGLDVRPILYPTVPRGQERLRIVLHAFNTEKEVDLLLNCLENSL